MGQIDGAAHIRDLASLRVQLSLNLGGSRQLHVQSFADVEKLILNHRKDVRAGHRRSGWSAQSSSPSGSPLS